MPSWILHLLPNMGLFAVIWLPIAMVPGPSTAVVIRQCAWQWSGCRGPARRIP